MNNTPGRLLTPIEQMVDAACGLKYPMPRQVWVSCPGCLGQFRVSANGYDPENAYRVEATCPDCSQKGAEMVYRYFDREGNEVPVDWNALKTALEEQP